MSQFTSASPGTELHGGIRKLYLLTTANLYPTTVGVIAKLNRGGD